MRSRRGVFGREAQGKGKEEEEGVQMATGCCLGGGKGAGGQEREGKKKWGAKRTSSIQKNEWLTFMIKEMLRTGTKRRTGRHPA